SAVTRHQSRVIGHVAPVTHFMLKFVFHRILLMIPTLVGVAVLVFFLLRLMPGDPVATMLLGDGGANMAPGVIAAERARLGLDQPLYVQFFKWFWGVLRGDLGYSMWTGKPVTYEIAIRLELS